MGKRPGKKRYPEVDKEIILDALKNGLSPKQVAKEYGITISMVYHVKDTAEKFNSRAIDEIADELNNIPPIKKAEKNIINIDDLISKPIEEEEKEEVQKPKRGRRGISKETVDKVIYELGLNNLKHTEIAAKYGISYSSVMRIKKDNEEKEKNNNIFMSLDADKFHRVQGQKYVKLGLVADRHKINPVTDYIFETFDNQLMFDYDRQYQIVEKMLSRYIHFADGKPLCGLMLYATGLQAALVSVMKVCDDKKIPLVVMHYNSDDGCYYPQNYSGDSTKFSSDVPYVIEKTVERSRQFFLYGCTTEDLEAEENANNVYEICECQYDSSVGSINRNILWLDTIIFIDEDAAWTAFREKSKNMATNTSVFLNKDIIQKGRLYKDKNIARASD